MPKPYSQRRRSAPFSPYVSISAKDSSRITQSGSRVSAWASRTSGISYAQVTGANQPLYVANALGGRPGIYFDGLTTAKHMTAAITYAGATGITIYTVFMAASIPANRDVYGATGGNSVRTQFNTGVVTTSWSAGGGFTNRTNNATRSAMVPYDISATFDLTGVNAAIEVYVNGATATNTYTLGPSPVGTPGASTQQLGAHGGASAIDGYIFEHLIYKGSAIHTASERAQVDAYLAAEWGI